MSLDFWLPQFKYEYVEWLEKHYPRNRYGKTIGWKNYTFERIKSIYISIRTKQEKQNAPSVKKAYRDYTEPRNPKY